MKILQELFTQIETIELTAEDFLSNNNYSGNGHIKIISTDSSVILKCNGKWKDNHNKISSFSFSYRFIFGSKEILIEHMRYGLESPVYLCILKQREPEYFVSDLPHVCSDDLYSAELYIENNSILLNWKITGPKKDMELNYIFY